MCTPHAEYLQSAHANGTNGKALYAVPGQLDDKIEDLLYEEWSITTKFFVYNLWLSQVENRNPKQTSVAR